MGVPWRLSRIASWAKARELTFFPRKFGADVAVDLGLGFDHTFEYPPGRRRPQAWIDDRSFQPWQSTYDGLQTAPQAFCCLLAGKTTGTAVVRVAGASRTTGGRS